MSDSANFLFKSLKCLCKKHLNSASFCNDWPAHSMTSNLSLIKQWNKQVLRITTCLWDRYCGSWNALHYFFI